MTTSAEMELHQHKTINRQLAQELTRSEEKNTDLLTNHVAGIVTPAASTFLTWMSAFAMGAADGALGARRFIGPVPVSAVVSLALGIGGVMADNPDLKEALHAGARGTGTGPAYQLGYEASLGYFYPDQLAALKAAAAAAAAAQAGGKTPAAAA